MYSFSIGGRDVACATFSTLFFRENLQCTVLQVVTSEVVQEDIFTGDEGLLMCSIK